MSLNKSTWSPNNCSVIGQDITNFNNVLNDVIPSDNNTIVNSDNTTKKKKMKNHH